MLTESVSPSFSLNVIFISFLKRFELAKINSIFMLNIFVSSEMYLVNDCEFFGILFRSEHSRLIILRHIVFFLLILDMRVYCICRILGI